ncbi:hypothetical protein [Paenibacillus campi]|uniref:hypothetical protein n=1 Tax=Paenibacillus campi TaxID=3106031 RepID=UPI002AFEC291|nr:MULTISPECIES: hypothetical protein [unclassified Paenibacillus]
MMKTMMGILGAGAASLIFLTSASVGTATPEAMAKAPTVQAATVTTSVAKDTYSDTTPADGTFTVFINKIDRDNKGSYKLTIDPINWYTGEAANKMFAKDNPENADMGAPDGYYIVNDDTRTYDYTAPESAQVLMQIYDHTGRWEDIDTNWNEPVSMSKLRAIFQKPDLLDPTVFPYHITVKNGEIVKIVQQFIP